MKDTLQIGLACFVGGALCVAIALLFSPGLWWIGTLAGFAAGYLGYEFHEVLRAIPIAFRGSIEGAQVAVESVWVWLRKPHPFFYSALLIGLLAGGSCAYFFYPHLNPELRQPLASIVTSVGASIVSFTLSLCIITGLAEVGCNVESSGPIFSAALIEVWNRAEFDSYKRFMRAVVVGLLFLLLAVVCFIFWIIWKSIHPGLWKLLKLIHSYKRLMCAVAGTLGGIAALWIYAYSHTGAVTLAEYAVVTFFGGLLGVALGVANWEIVSKRIFHVTAPAKSN